jgi:hypothetical protein
MVGLGVVLATFVAAPSALIIGWVRVAKHAQPRTAASLAGFILATLSLMPLIYCLVLGGLQLQTYVPSLFRAYKWGTVLAVIGLIVSVGGVLQRNSLRWLAPLLSISMIVLWRLWTIDVT